MRGTVTSGLDHWVKVLNWLIHLSAHLSGVNNGEKVNLFNANFPDNFVRYGLPYCRTLTKECANMSENILDLQQIM